jgi:DNA-binding MarR family transcriptional regulator
MGLKENMMENMMKGMSAEERKQMMESMMDSFMGSMSDAEKKSMMNEMMPKMMGSMMGGSGGGGMMGSMGSMMSMMGGSGEKGGFNPMDMCKTMMGNMSKASEMATYATPEIRTLFEEWAAQIEEEILAFIKKEGMIDPASLSEKFKLSKDSVNYFLVRLSEKGKINLKAEMN